MPPNSDRIAICGEFLPVALKHHLLFFDRVGVFRPEQMVRELHKLKTNLAINLVNDLEFLQSRNIVFDVYDFVDFKTYLLEGRKIDDDPAGFYEQSFGEFSDNYIRGSPWLKGRDFPEAIFQLRSRASARLMQNDGLAATAVLSKPLAALALKVLYPSVSRKALTTDVIDIVLDQLPMPSELTPWEAILDFRADTEAQGYLQGLKVWMSEIARQELTATEAREKLDWLLFQHQQHMKAHKLAYQWGTLGGAFVATAEILEDLVKFKWGKAVGAVVSIVDRRLELMKAELANPAKEISYIVKAQEQFGG